MIVLRLLTRKFYILIGVVDAAMPFGALSRKWKVENVPSYLVHFLDPKLYLALCQDSESSPALSLYANQRINSFTGLWNFKSLVSSQSGIK